MTDRSTWVRRLQSPDWFERCDAAMELGKQAAPEAFEILAAPGRHEPRLVSVIMDGLVEGAPTTVSPMLSVIRDSPGTTTAILSILALGEILGNQGIHADPRVVPALLALLRTTAPRGAWESQYVVSAIRHGVDVDALRPATRDLLELLRLSHDDPEPYSHGLQLVLEILLIWEGMTIFPKLAALAESLHETHPLVQLVRVIQRHGFDRLRSLEDNLPPNRDQWNRQLRSLLRGANADAAYRLGKIGAPEVFRLLADDERYPNVEKYAVEGLIEGAPATIEPILGVIEGAPYSSEGGHCLYALGEVAYRQGTQRDPRILPVLLKCLKDAVPRGTEMAGMVVHAIRECARATPIRDATEDLLEFLRVSKSEPDPNEFDIVPAVETLLISEGIVFLQHLRELARSFPESHPFHDVLACVDPETFDGQIDWPPASVPSPGHG